MTSPAMADQETMTTGVSMAAESTGPVRARKISAARSETTPWRMRPCASTSLPRNAPAARPAMNRATSKAIPV